MVESVQPLMTENELALALGQAMIHQHRVLVSIKKWMDAEGRQMRLVNAGQSPDWPLYQAANLRVEILLKQVTL